MKSDTFGLPQNVYDAFVRKARSKMLEHYFGDRRRLKPMIEVSSDLIVPFFTIFGASLSDKQGEGNRIARRLVKRGLLLELARRRQTQAVEFFLPDVSQAEILLAQAHSYWQSKGYIESVIMDRVH